jgi:hypothetical protein
MGMLLKPQDVVIVLKLVAVGDVRWTYVQLYYQLYISASEINAGIKRLAQANLVILDHENRNVPPAIVRTALIEFLIHGVKYAYPPERGELTRGMPTAYAAPPLSRKILQPKEPPPVWPDKDSKVKGYSFSPLYKTVPKAARQDSKLYKLLALVDAVRDGRARERKMAERELTKRITTK